MSKSTNKYKPIFREAHRSPNIIAVCVFIAAGLALTGLFFVLGYAADLAQALTIAG